MPISCGSGLVTYARILGTNRMLSLKFDLSCQRELIKYDTHGDRDDSRDENMYLHIRWIRNRSYTCSMGPLGRMGPHMQQLQLDTLSPSASHKPSSAMAEQDWTALIMDLTEEQIRDRLVKDTNM